MFGSGLCRLPAAVPFRTRLRDHGVEGLRAVHEPEERNQ
ncbi:hypothetical protein ABIB35_000988 [Arthrobacter sp. UYP6]